MTSHYAGPEFVKYMFIDGAQLEQTLKSVGEEWLERPIELNYTSLQGEHQRVFYFDCLPAQGSLDDAAFKTRVSEKESFFRQLNSIPGWHVNQGIAHHRKKRGQEQKEVDIQIAVEVLTHTHRRNMNRLTFVSGDQDFAPLIEAVVRDGMYVQLLYPEGHTSDDLKSFADVATPMDIDFLYAHASSDLRNLNLLPSKLRSLEYMPHSCEVIQRGINSSGQTVAYSWQELSGVFRFKECLAPRDASEGLIVTYKNYKKAKKYFERFTGSLIWSVHADYD